MNESPAAVSACPERQLLTAFYDGLLFGQEWNKIADHLEACPSCVAVLDRSPPPPDPLTRRLQAISTLRDSDIETIPCVRPDHPRTLHQRGEATIDTGPPVGELGRDVPTEPPAKVGPYELIRMLGKGGMGAVYLARHIHLNKKVAVKLLPADRMADPETIRRFRKEMRAAGALEHPNIVRATDGGTDGTNEFLVMELIEGTDLSRLVKQNGPFLISQACNLIQQAAYGLQHIHEAGLVHRDIKPSNLILTTSGTVKILDLGLAMLREPGEDQTNPGHVMGTVDYMAPEQASDSRNVDIRADIYSLGCTLYTLLAGRPPFIDAEYPGYTARLLAHAMQTPRPIIERRPDTPPALAALIHRMLEKAPSRRPQQPREVAEALTPFIRETDESADFSLSPPETIAVDHQVGIPIHPNQQPAPGSVRKNWNRRVVALLVLPLLVAGVVAAVFAFRGRTDDLAMARPTSPAPGVAGSVAFVPDRGDGAPQVIDALPSASPENIAKPSPKPPEPAPIPVPPPPSSPTELRHDFPLTAEIVGGSRSADGVTILKEGEEIGVLVSTTRNAYVGVWWTAPDGAITQLFPNRFEPNHFLAAGSKRLIPGHDDYAIAATPSAGVESIRVIASTTPWKTIPGRLEGPYSVYATHADQMRVADLFRGLRLKGREQGESPSSASPQVSEVVLPFQVR